MQAGPPLLQKPRAELGYDTLGRQLGHGGLEAGKGAHKALPELVELGVALADVHVAPLACFQGNVSALFLPTLFAVCIAGGYSRSRSRP